MERSGVRNPEIESGSGKGWSRHGSGRSFSVLGQSDEADESHE